jgi:hypothetical protein
MNLRTFLACYMVEQTLSTSETTTHWALASERQRTVSHMCMTRDCLLHVQTISYKSPLAHVCRLVLSHSLMQRERCELQRNIGNILEFSVQKYIRKGIFPHGTKSLLTSIIVPQCVILPCGCSFRDLPICEPTIHHSNRLSTSSGKKTMGKAGCQFIWRWLNEM